MAEPLARLARAAVAARRRLRRSPRPRSIAPFGCAPITAAAGSPSLKRMIVGIDWTP